MSEGAYTRDYDRPVKSTQQIVSVSSVPNVNPLDTQMFLFFFFFKIEVCFSIWDRARDGRSRHRYAKRRHKEHRWKVVTKTRRTREATMGQTKDRQNVHKRRWVILLAKVKGLKGPPRGGTQMWTGTRRRNQDGASRGGQC